MRVIQNSFMYEVHSKSYKPHTENRAIVEYSCCGKTLPLLMKLRKLILISVLIPGQMRLIKRWKGCDKSKNGQNSDPSNQSIRNIWHPQEDMAQILAEDSPLKQLWRSGQQNLPPAVVAETVNYGFELLPHSPHSLDFLISNHESQSYFTARVRRLRTKKFLIKYLVSCSMTIIVFTTLYHLK